VPQLVTFLSGRDRIAEAQLPELKKNYARYLKAETRQLYKEEL
jgi:hypothetical protein